MDQERSINYGWGEAQASERSFMSQVYFWMAMGLALTGFVAGWMAIHPNVMIGLMRNSMLFMLLALAQIGIVFWLSAAAAQMSLMAATAGFSIYATLNGVLFSTIFLVYTGASIASTFFITAGVFGAVSVYGFVTKRDLTSAGSFGFMALIGLILASIVNWFLKSPALDWLISYAGIAIFIVLTAYDTQRLKQFHHDGVLAGGMVQKMALLGALVLYLDFINLFLMLLRVFGRRK